MFLQVLFFFFAHQSEYCWSGRIWGKVDGIRAGDDVSSCRASFQFLGLSSLFRELKCGVTLALQSSSPVHLGVDNLGVVRHAGRLL